MYKVFKHKDRQEIEYIIAAIDAVSIVWNTINGRPFIQINNTPMLIGQNAATNELEPNAVGTFTWDIPKQATDGEWYCQDPSNDPRFINWKDYLYLTDYAVTMESIEWYNGW